MVRVKCLAQAHNTMPRPGLEPGPLVLKSSAVTMRPPRELNLTNLVRWINSLIFLFFSKEYEKRGPGFFKFNNALLDDKNFIEEFKEPKSTHKLDSI